MKEAKFRLPNHIFRNQIYQWISQFPYFAIYDSANYLNVHENKYHFIAAGGWQCVTNWFDFTNLYAPQSWYFVALSYDLKNYFEPHLPKPKSALIPFPEVVVFIPTVIFYVKQQESQTLYILANDPNKVFNKLKKTKYTPPPCPPLHFQAVENRKNYNKKIELIKEHILLGDVYELNYTLPFYAYTKKLDVLNIFQRLRKQNPAPYSALFRFKKQYLICASPERFLHLAPSGVLTTQPIKGTISRKGFPLLDDMQKKYLQTNEKFIAENVMIVDLARNDLYRSSLTNGVQVPKLFEVQSFKYLHHLVSTIKGIKVAEVSPLQAIANAFPAGSMTGAPKIRAMELIHDYERYGRGLYAGSVGYFAPDGSFDLNVVIRSLFFDETQKMIQFQVGGAITADSNAQDEYQEAILKSKALQNLFSY